jgi:hypothetical protein
MSWQEYKKRRRRWRKITLLAPFVALVATAAALGGILAAGANGASIPAAGALQKILLMLLGIEGLLAVVSFTLYVTHHENFAHDSDRPKRFRKSRRDYASRRSQARPAEEAAEPAPAAEASRPPETPTVESQPALSAEEPASHVATRAVVHHAEGLRVPESMVIDDLDAGTA